MVYKLPDRRPCDDDNLSTAGSKKQDKTCSANRSSTYSTCTAACLPKLSSTVHKAKKISKKLFRKVKKKVKTTFKKEKDERVRDTSKDEIMPNATLESSLDNNDKEDGSSYLSGHHHHEEVLQDRAGMLSRQDSASLRFMLQCRKYNGYSSSSLNNSERDFDQEHFEITQANHQHQMGDAVVDSDNDDDDDDDDDGDDLQHYSNPRNIVRFQRQDTEECIIDEKSSALPATLLPRMDSSESISLQNLLSIVDDDNNDTTNKCAKEPVLEEVPNEDNSSAPSECSTPVTATLLTAQDNMDKSSVSSVVLDALPVDSSGRNQEIWAAPLHCV